MGREVRMVPADWQHPKEYNPYLKKQCYRPLLDRDYSVDDADWSNARAELNSGDRSSHVSNGFADMPYDELAGDGPWIQDYMPQWSASERTHLMMYETVSAGTPISPAFATPEELARWLTDNGVSAFMGLTASYEGWLRVAKAGMVASGSGLDSGVEAG